MLPLWPEPACLAPADVATVASAAREPGIVGSPLSFVAPESAIVVFAGRCVDMGNMRGYWPEKLICHGFTTLRQEELP